MRGIYGRGDVLAGALILSVFVSLFTLTQIVRSADDSPWSSVSPVNIERVKEVSQEIFNTTPTVPCEDQEFSWKAWSGGWVSRIVTTPYTRCAVAMQDAYFETSSSTQGRIRSFSSKDKTFGFNFPALANVHVFAVPGSTSIVVNSWAYQNYYGGTPGLHIVRDYRTTMRDTGPDSAGNKIYAPAKPFDFELRGPDGKLVPIQAGGLKFSPNGQWMVFKINYGGNVNWARINLETYEVLAFAQPVQYTYAVHNAISNDGRYIALYEPTGNFRVYDLEKCSNGADKLLSQRCAFVELSPQLKTKLGANEVHFRNLAFKGDRTISLYVMTKKSGDTTWKLGEYLVRYGELPTSNGYLAMGDSFSSGEGAYDYRSQTDFYIDDTQYNLCHQSRSSYPYLLNKTIGFEWFGSVACSGAKTTDVIYRGNKTHYRDDNPQAKGLEDDDSDVSIFTNLLPGYREQGDFPEKLTQTPEVATLTMGGNDMGFGDIVAACVNPLYAQTCYESRDRREQLADLIDTLIPSLTTTYKKVKESAAPPDFRLYVIGYPHVVSSEGECGLNVGMDHYEREFAQRLVDYLNDAIRVAATKAGARYVNVSNAFIESERDHRLCGNQTNLAINGLVIRGSTSKKPGRPEYQESYHPNLLGHALLASKINQETQSLTQEAPPELPSMSVVKQDESLRKAFVGDDKQLIDIKKPGYDHNLAQGPATRGESLGYKSSSNWPVAEPNNKAVIELHSTPIKLGESSFDSEGRLTGSVTIPADIEPGYHELHVKYNDFFGDSVDRYQIIFVRASAEDYDGDGVPNNTDPCTMSSQSGVDSDEDGIDDACDDEYVMRASTGDGEQSRGEDTTRVTESIAVLAAQPQSTSTARGGDEEENIVDSEEGGAEGYVLDENIDMQTFGTDGNVGGYVKRKHINVNEVLIVVGVLAVVSTATLLGSKLLARRSS